MDREKLIADYEAAYLAANGCPGKLLYKNGWYSVRGGWLKGRQNDVVAWTENLRRRAERLSQ